MDCNVEVLIWNMTGDDKYDQGSLEKNGLQHDNTLCNVIGADNIWIIRTINWTFGYFAKNPFNVSHDYSISLRI